MKQQVSVLSLNGSGIRDPARELPLSPAPVIQEVKEKARPSRR